MNLLFAVLAIAVLLVIFAVCACVKVSAEYDSPPAAEEDDPQEEYRKKILSMIRQKVNTVLTENGEGFGLGVAYFKDELRLIGTIGAVSDNTKILLHDTNQAGIFELLTFADEYGVSVDYLLGRKDTDWIQ